MGEPRHSLGIKLLLLALYLAFDHAAIVERVGSLGLSVGLAAYVALYIALAAALVAAALDRQVLTRVALGAALATGSVALHGYEWATNSPLTYDAFETMVASSGDVPEALRQHGGSMLRALAAAMILFAAIALPPGRFSLPVGLGWTIPAGAVGALAVLLYVRGGEGTRALPAPFAPLAHGGIMATMRLVQDDRPREEVALVPAPPPGKGDVVLVIDESIAAKYLDINDPAGVYSGLAEGLPAVTIANFGVAASVTNCSTGSNLTLRFGGTRANYREVASNKPSIWAYARRAGYRTVYLDGQRTGGELQNLMTVAEQTEINDFIQLDSTPVMDRDHELARLIGDRLQNGAAELIIVNKVGAHFPVADKFPAAAAAYLPIPAQGYSVGITDIGSLPGLHATTEDEWRLYRNAYRNTVRWSTGGFFDILLPRVPGTMATIIYTSDHGQTLQEHGGSGGATHCTTDPPQEEGAVPLVVISDSQSIDWRAHASANFHAISHFRVFPTLLNLMGYGTEQTAAYYGPTLMSHESDPFTFTPNYNASLGRKPRWLRISADELARPPDSDHRQVAYAR